MTAGARRGVASCLAAFACTATATVAAAQARDPVGGLVADLHALTVTLPTSEGWTPPVISTTPLVPGRGFGGELGAHVVFGPGRYKRLGLGASGLFAQGRATGPGGAPPVTTRLSTAAAHVSANFGHRLGWSYLSAGGGGARVTSEAAGGAPDPAGWGPMFHYGGGARWFVNERIGVSFDLRFWALAARAATADRPPASSNTRIAFAAGLSLR